MGTYKRHSNRLQSSCPPVNHDDHKPYSRLSQGFSAPERGFISLTKVVVDIIEMTKLRLKKMIIKRDILDDKSMTTFTVEEVNRRVISGTPSEMPTGRWVKRLIKADSCNKESCPYSRREYRQPV